MPVANAVGASPPTENIARTNGVRRSPSQTSSGTAIVMRAPGIGPTFPPRCAVQFPGDCSGISRISCATPVRTNSPQRPTMIAGRRT